MAASTEDVKLKFGGSESPLWTTDINGEVPIFMPPDAKGVQALPPMTLTALFHETAQKNAASPAINWRVAPGTESGDVPSFYTGLVAKAAGNVWNSMTWQALEQECYKFGSACLANGVEKKDAVIVMGFNTPQWLLAFYGTVMAGGVVAGSYPTNTTETCEYLAKDCGARIVLAESWANSGERFVEVLKDESSKLAKIVVWGSMEGVPEELLSSKAVLSFVDFMATADEDGVGKVKEIEGTLKPTECCDLIYTSGTTGPPKGVMLSHDNLTWDARASAEMFQEKSGNKLGPEDVILSYLPLSHIAAQVLDFMTTCACGGQIFFATPDALKGGLLPLLQETRPTFFFGVPRVWEKIMDAMKAKGAANSGLKKKISLWAKERGLKHNMALAKSGGKTGDGAFKFGIFNKLAYSKVKALLGFDRCNLLGSGAAPISKEVLSFFWGLDLKIVEGFGMSETTGIATVSHFPRVIRLGCVGAPIDPDMIKLDYEKGKSQQEEGHGEICMRGRNIMMGYLNKPEKTAETFDEERYLRSGDLGKFYETADGDKLLAITGRIKELIITAGGENIPPVPIEDAIKANCPMLSNVVLIGEKRKFLSILVTLRVVVDPDSLEPTDKLDPNCLLALAAAGSEAKTCAEAKEDKLVLEGIQKGIDKYNEGATSRAQRVQKFTILDGDFSVPGGELTGTQKLKRPIVAKKYAEQIEAFYA